MATPDVFALTTSALNPFLFAGVGTEMNGSELTILSLLARLGSDPWAEAGRLAALPRATATDWLAERIAQTPLRAESLGEARATAMRLIALLPSPARLRSAPAAASAPAAGVQVPPWAFIALLCCVFAVGVAVNAAHDPAPQKSQATEHVTQPGQ